MQEERQARVEVLDVVPSQSCGCGDTVARGTCAARAAE